jgi:hypothetical protein
MNTFLPCVDGDEYPQISARPRSNSLPAGFKPSSTTAFEIVQSDRRRSVVDVKVNHRAMTRPRDLAKKVSEVDITGNVDMSALMIKNIPCGCSKEEVLKAIEDLGFGDDVDFFHLPLRKTKAIGYAFVGFSNPDVPRRFQEAMTGYRFPGRNSSKVVSIAPGHIQGIENINNHLKSTAAGRRAKMPQVEKPQQGVLCSIEK